MDAQFKVDDIADSGGNVRGGENETLRSADLDRDVLASRGRSLQATRKAVARVRQRFTKRATEVPPGQRRERGRRQQPKRRRLRNA